jgi:hypothetical protein
MDEAAARQYLIADSRRLLDEWREGRDWQWYGREGGFFNLEVTDADLQKNWASYPDLAATWWYLDAFVDSMQHGFPKLDGVTWEDSVLHVENIIERLEAGLPIKDERIVRFWRASSTGCNPFAFLFRRRTSGST